MELSGVVWRSSSAAMEVGVGLLTETGRGTFWVFADSHSRNDLPVGQKVKATIPGANQAVVLPGEASTDRLRQLVREHWREK